MGQDKHSLWKDLVSKVARFVAKDFPETEEEDLAQDLMLFVLQNDRLVSPDQDYAARGLSNKARQLAWEYRKQGLYATAQYAYRTSDVSRMLETIFCYEDWDQTFVPVDARSLKGFSDALDIASDVKTAYGKLSANYKRVIHNRYGLKLSPADEAEKKMLYRAIERLTDYLNTYKSPKGATGPGTRKVISNTAANSAITHNNEGGVGFAY